MPLPAIAIVARLHEERRATLPLEDLPVRQAWRDHPLAVLRAHREEAEGADRPGRMP